MEKPWDNILSETKEISIMVKNSGAYIFSLLAIPNIGELPHLNQDHDLGFSIKILQKPEKVLTSIGESHWMDWLGKIAWREIMDSKHVVMCIREKNKTQNIDIELKNIAAILSGTFYHALILAAPFAGTDSRGNPSRLLCGFGDYIDNNFVINTIETTSSISKWQPPSYRENLDYYYWMHIQYPEKVVIEKLKRLVSCLQPIFSIETVNYDSNLFRMSLEIFRLGISNPSLDIVFPHLVRSIETVIALPQKKQLPKKQTMAKEFCRRVLKYYTLSDNNLYKLTQEQLENILVEIYDLRSDSVHGKPLAWRLKQNNSQFSNDDLAKLEFVCETAARSLLVAALENNLFMSLLDDRTKIENAWLNSQL